MLPLYQDSWFTFRFAEDRIVPRIHLEGVEKGRRVSILLATGIVGDGGWVDLLEPIVVRAGEALLCRPRINSP